MPTNGRAAVEDAADELLGRIHTDRYSLPAGHEAPMHSHTEAQLLFATDGAMHTTTAGGSWFVPCRQALWLPAGMDHAMEVRSSITLQTIYFEGTLPNGLYSGSTILSVSPLLRELLCAIGGAAKSRQRNDGRRSLLTLLMEELADASDALLELPLPADRRARKVAEAVLADLSAECPFEDIARQSGATGRTIRRQFQRETGMSFSLWRQRARVIRGSELLTAGVPVTEAAFTSGYQSPSAFVTAFRRHFGVSPREYRGSRG